jgi:hypothetical protein
LGKCDDEKIIKKKKIENGVWWERVEWLVEVLWWLAVVVIDSWL